MKKYTLLLIICIICLLSGCNAGNTEYKMNSAVDLKDLIEPGEELTCAYADSSSIILSIGNRNGKVIGPLVDTDRLLLKNYSDGSSSTLKLETEAYIINAIPYNDGLLYSTYVLEDDLYRWSVIYESDNERISIDEGTCSDCTYVPGFAMVNDRICYLSINKAGESWEQSVKLLTGYRSDAIFSVELESVSEPRFFSNGKEYCFIADTSGPAEYFIGTEEGITLRGGIEGEISSFGINDSYMVIGTVDEGEDFDKPYIFAIDLSSGETNSVPSEVISYRIAGSGNEFLCVDSEFSVFALDTTGKDLAWKQISEFGDFDITNNPVLFFSAGDGKFVCEITGSSDGGNEKEYICIGK